MKMAKKLLVFLTAIAMLLSLVSVTTGAAGDDPLDTTYYTAIQPLTTFEDKTPQTLPTTENSDKSNYGTFYLEEEDGNIYWSVNRYLDKTVDSAWNAGFYTPASGTMGNKAGEYVIQHKMKFNQFTGTLANIGFRINHGGSNGRQLYFGISSLNVSDNTQDSIFFKVEWQKDSSTVLNQEFKLGGYAFQPEVWYLFRQVYNLDTMKAKLELWNKEGTELLYTTGEIDLPETVTSGEDSFTIPYNLTFAGVRADINRTKGAGVGVDDFVMVKSTNKPVTVTCNEGGTVTYNNAAIASGTDVPVPYNSADAATFTVAADEDHVIKEIKVNGQAVTMNEIEFTSVTTAQTLDVTFEQKAAAPSLGEKAPAYTYTDEQGAQTAYFSINPGYGYTFTDGIAKIYEVGNEASEANPIKLENQSWLAGLDSNWEGKFGIRVFGSAMQQGKQYVLAPYLKAEREGEETIVLDPIGENQEDGYSFTFGSDE